MPAPTDRWLIVAERLDAMRLVPRLALGAYVTFTMSCIAWLLGWFMELPAVERSGEVAAFVTGTISALLGGMTWFLSAYVHSGRDWKDNPATRDGE